MSNVEIVVKALQFSLNVGGFLLGFSVGCFFWYDFLRND